MTVISVCIIRYIIIYQHVYFIRKTRDHSDDNFRKKDLRPPDYI